MSHSHTCHRRSPVSRIDPPCADAPVLSRHPPRFARLRRPDGGVQTEAKSSVPDRARSFARGVARRASADRHPRPNDARTAAAAVTRRSDSTRARQRVGKSLVLEEPASSGEYRVARSASRKEGARSWHTRLTFQSREREEGGGCSRNCSEARVQGAGAAGALPPAAGASVRRRPPPWARSRS